MVLPEDPHVIVDLRLTILTRLLTKLRLKNSLIEVCAIWQQFYTRIAAFENDIKVYRHSPMFSNIVLAHLTKFRMSYCTNPSIGVSVSKILKFYDKVFYVMGKALTGELSCPCDRSC